MGKTRRLESQRNLVWGKIIGLAWWRIGFVLHHTIGKFQNRDQTHVGNQFQEFGPTRRHYRNWYRRFEVWKQFAYAKMRSPKHDDAWNHYHHRPRYNGQFGCRRKTESPRKNGNRIRKRPFAGIILRFILSFRRRRNHITRATSGISPSSKGQKYVKSFFTLGRIIICLPEFANISFPQKR